MTAVINVENNRIFKDIFVEGEDVGHLSEAVNAAWDMCELNKIYLTGEQKLKIAELNLVELRLFRRFVFNHSFEETMILVKDAPYK